MLISSRIAVVRGPLKNPIFWKETGLERLYLMASIFEEEDFSDLSWVRFEAVPPIGPIGPVESAISTRAASSPFG